MRGGFNDFVECLPAFAARQSSSCLTFRLDTVESEIVGGKPTNGRATRPFIDLKVKILHQPVPRF